MIATDVAVSFTGHRSVFPKARIDHASQTPEHVINTTTIHIVDLAFFVNNKDLKGPKEEKFDFEVLLTFLSGYRCNLNLRLLPR
ncbi:MAG: hypothetical protein ACK55Z_23615 [bacterium]